MFVSFSSDFVLGGNTLVDNTFLSEFLPKAPDMCVKVYLYGLFLCGHAESPDNSLENMARELELTESDIINAYTYWQELGLVTILNISPVAVKYLPVKRAQSLKKYQDQKYAEFNRQVEALLNRTPMPNEFNEYYYCIEYYGFEPQAFLMIIKYCVDLKGPTIGYKYILTVARNWAAEGAVTCARVEEKILEYDKVTESLIEVFKAMGSKKYPDVDDRAMYVKWTKSLEFDKAVILYVASNTKKGGIHKLDGKLTKYYENKVLTIPEIEDFEKDKTTRYNLARRLNKIIGVHYEQVDFIVEKYISLWLGQGFEDKALELIAEACFKTNIRTWEGFAGKVAEFYKQGILTVKAFDAYMGRLNESDKKIKEIYKVLGLENSTVTSRDRDSYRTWTYMWGFSDEIILYCAGLAKGAAYPFSYMNKILADWHTQNITTLEKAKEATITVATATAAKKDKSYITKKDRVYTQEEFNALIDDISRIG